jgi:hypothetical protein
MNAITYKEIFTLIKEGKIWLGVNKPCWFEIPATVIRTQKNSSKENKVHLSPVRWFTNLGCYVDDDKKELELTAKYDTDKQILHHKTFTPKLHHLLQKNIFFSVLRQSKR